MKTKALFVLFALFGVVNLYAQVPTITSFKNAAGTTIYSAEYGQTIKIVGTNFGTTPGSNVVYIGNTKVIPSVQTSTEITVSMPRTHISPEVVVCRAGLCSSIAHFKVAQSTSGDLFLGFSGTFSAVTSKAISGFTSNGVSADRILLVNTGDFDNDGDLDILAPRGTNKIGLLVNPGPMNFSVSNFSEVDVTMNTSGNQTYKYAMFSDLDADGDLDILAAVDGTNVIRYALNDGTGGYGNSSQWTLPISDAITHLQVCDMNNDGRLDLVTLHASKLLVWFQSTTPLSFSTVAGNFITTSLTNSLSGGHLRIGRLNPDAFPDIVVARGKPYLASLHLATTTSGVLSSYSNTTIESTGGYGTYSRHQLVDLNKDGYLDFTWATASSGNGLKSFLNDGQGVFTENASWSTTNVFRYSNVFDLDGDGDYDFLGATFSGLGGCRKDANSYSSEVDLVSYSYAQEEVVADFNNDGYPDWISINNLNNALLYSSYVGATPSATITPNQNSLAQFTACTSTASSSQSLSVSATGLSGNITVTAPTGFQLSLNNSSWSSQLTINKPSSSASLSNTTVYVRMQGSSSSPAAGQIKFATSGALNKFVSLDGLVYAKPSTPSVTPVTICDQGVANLEVSAPVGGETYTWYNSSNSIIGTGSSLITPTLAASSSQYTFYVRATANGCESNSGTATVYSYLVPTITSNNVERCGAGTVILSATANYSGTLSWWTSVSGGAQLASGANYSVTNLSTSSDYYVQAENACGISSRQKVSAIINAIYTPSVSGNERCGVGNLTLQAIGQNGSTFLWYDNSESLLSSSAGSYVINNLTSNTTYKLKEVSALGCTTNVFVPFTATIATSALWNGTGDWSDGTKWSCGNGTTPSGAENITVVSGTLGLNSDIEILSGSTLTVANNAALTIAPSYALTIASGATLANAGTVVVDADANDYGQLLLKGTYTPTGSGTVTVKRAYNVSSAPSYAKWIQISSPVSGNLAQLGNNIQANNLFYWDAQNNNWEPATGASTFDAGKGYTAFYGPNGVSTSQSGTITLSGTPFNNVAIPTVKWSNGVSNNALFYTSQKAGWNLIGNPFTCNLDYSTFSRSNVDNAFYRWDPNKGGAGQAGYHAHAPAAADYNDVTIPPLTAVWIRASNNTSPGLGNGNITHANNGRRNNNKPFKNTPDKFLLTVSDLSAPSLADNLSLAMVPGTSDEFDGEWDAWELINSNQLPNVYANFNAEWTTAKAIDFNDQASVVKVVPVGVKSPIEMRPYRMHLDANLAQPGYTVYLRDLHLNQVHNLSTSDYVFAYTSAMEDRFELILTNAKTGALGLEEASRGALTAWVSGSELWITGLESGAQELDVVGMDGRVVLSTALRAEEGQPVTTALPELPAGLYTVRVRANGLERGVRFAVQK